MGFFKKMFSRDMDKATALREQGEKNMTGGTNKPMSEENIKKIKQHWIYNEDARNGVKITLTADDVAVIEDDGKQTVIDGVIWKNRIDGIFKAVDYSLKHDYSKYCPIPKSVEIIFNGQNTIEQKNEPKVTPSAEDMTTKASVADSILVREPRWTFDDIYINATAQEDIQKTLLIARHRQKLFSEWKLGNGNNVGRAIVFNFYGPSGTGKSMTGEAIAGQLGKKVYAVNYSELESKYVGETPKNIVAAFQRAQKDNAVLIFDEADSFLGKRLTNVTQSSDYGVNITRSVMLMELEKFDGIVIFTTNLITNYDEAFKRRILTSIAFELPDESGREKIWQIYLRRGLPLAQNITPALLAKKFIDISGADIKDILLYAAVASLYRNEKEPCLDMTDFDCAYKMILERRKTTAAPKVTVRTEQITEEQYLEETAGQS